MNLSGSAAAPCDEEETSPGAPPRRGADQRSGSEERRVAGCRMGGKSVFGLVIRIEADCFDKSFTHGTSMNLFIFCYFKKDTSLHVSSSGSKIHGPTLELSEHKGMFVAGCMIMK